MSRLVDQRPPAYGEGLRMLKVGRRCFFRTISTYKLRVLLGLSGIALVIALLALGGE